MSGEAMGPCPPDSELMKAWEAHQATEEFKNSKHWALMILPMWQAGGPSEKTRFYELMPLEQRERHVHGSLWASFMAGFAAAGGKTAF